MRIVELSINYWALIVLALGGIPFIFVISNRQRTMNLVLMLAAFLIGLAFFFRAEKWWQPEVHPVLAVVISIATGGLIWLMTTKVLEAEGKRSSHDLGDLVDLFGD